MPDSPFVQLAPDPTLIPAVHDTCDQWCIYCPATARCLAFRLDPELWKRATERQCSAVIEIDDPLEKLSRSYAQLSRAYLMSRPDYPFELRPRATGPTPLEVLAWFHTLIAAKVCRALTSGAAAARGVEMRADDSLVSAKVALVGIDRSLEALDALAAGSDDPRHELLQALLRCLCSDVEARFPGARSIIRAGLDDQPDWTKMD
jgi:hypothetical protein